MINFFEITSWEERYIIQKEDTSPEQFKDDCKKAAEAFFYVYPESPWAGSFDVSEWLCENLDYVMFETPEENKIFCPSSLSREVVVDYKEEEEETTDSEPAQLIRPLSDDLVTRLLSDDE